MRYQDKRDIVGVSTAQITGIDNIEADAQLMIFKWNENSNLKQFKRLWKRFGKKRYWFFCAKNQLVTKQKSV